MLKALAVVAVAVLVAGACAGPSRTEADYRRKAASTLEQVRSAVETAALGVTSDGRHRLPSSYVAVLLAEAEEDASAAEATFASVQPPSGASDRVRAEVGDLVDEAVDALAELRIRARRGAVAARPEDLTDLRALGDRLDRRATALRG